MSEQSPDTSAHQNSSNKLERDPNKRQEEEPSAVEDENAGDCAGRCEAPLSSSPLLSAQSEKEERTGDAVDDQLERPQELRTENNVRPTEENQLKNLDHKGKPKRSGKRMRKEKHTEVHNDKCQDLRLESTCHSKSALVNRPDMNPSEDHICSTCQQPTHLSSVAPTRAPASHSHVTKRKVPILACSGSQHCPQPKAKRSRTFTKSCTNCTGDQGAGINGAQQLEFDTIDFGELAPPPKRCRTLYNPDQLELLEAMFEVERYPDTERRKAMAQLVGVTPQRVLVWFQNRRAKFKKINSLNGGDGRRRRSQPAASLKSEIPPQRPNSSFSGPYALILPQSSPEVASVPAQSAELFFSDPNMQADLNNPAPSTSAPTFSPKILPKFNHCNWISPPALRRANALQLLTSSYNPPPPFNTAEFTPPFVGDPTDGMFSKDNHDELTMQGYSSFPFNFMENFISVVPSQQNNNLFYPPPMFFPNGPIYENPPASQYQCLNPASASPRTYMTYCSEGSTIESAQNQRVVPMSLQPTGEQGKYLKQWVQAHS
ncbi:uncharacterized protein nobox [Synchiropus picturatus]